MIGLGRGGTLLKAYCQMWALQQFLMAGVCSLCADNIDVMMRSMRAREDGVSGSGIVNTANGTSLSETVSILGEMGCGMWLCVLAILCVQPSVWLLCVAQGVSLYMHWCKMPFVWDAELWDAQVELALLLACSVGMSSALANRRGDAPKVDASKVNTDGGDWLIRQSTSSIRAAILLLYWCTVLWKLSSSFFGPMSCGPVFTISLLDMLTPSSFDIDRSSAASSIVRFTAWIAPSLTVGVEAAIPLLLQFAPWQVGVLFGSFFHILIAITPPPNNASLFSVICIVKYFFFIPEEAIVRAWSRPPSALVAAFSVCVTAASISLGIEHGGDWGCPISFALVCVYVHAICPSTVTGENVKAPSTLKRKRSTFIECVVVLSTLTYALLVPLLGLMDMGTWMCAELIIPRLHP